MLHKHCTISIQSLGQGVLIALFAWLLAGCTVKYSFTGASIPPEAKTVSVQLFQNIAPQVNPTLSNYFTEELKNRFITQTKLVMVNDFGDFAFSGQISNYTVSPVSVQSNETAALNRLTISVRVKFQNKVDNKSSFDKTFSQYEDFPSSQSFVQLEEQLMQEIVKKIVEDIFNASAANW